MSVEMSSRERVLAAINHREPDRVPIDLGSTPSSGISAVAYSALLKHLDIDEKVRIYDVIQYLAEPGNPVLDRFGVDVIDVGRAWNTDRLFSVETLMPGGGIAYYPSWFRPVRKDDGSYGVYDEQGLELAVMPADAVFFDQSYFPWRGGYPDGRAAMDEALDEAMSKVMWAKYVHSPWDHASEEGFWEKLREKTMSLRMSTDKALMIAAGCNLFEWGTFLRGIDNFLMDLYLEPQKVALLTELLMERHMAVLEKLVASVGDLIDIIRFGDDLGMDSGPFMGLDVYRQLFESHRSRLCGYIHQNSGMATFLHSCGSIYQYIPSLIDSGIDIINPVQTNCRNMEADRLKAEFGRDVTFWGAGADPREILNNGSPEQVRDDVRRRMDILSAGGGFVFAGIHNILSEVPPENIVAMFEAASEF